MFFAVVNIFMRYVLVRFLEYFHFQFFFGFLRQAFHFYNLKDLEL